MCGICGILGFDNQAPSVERLRSMMDAIRHRGPDDEGLFRLGPVSLGFRRLSIIDLSTGHQPISTEDESVTVICNGEIYNHVDLRKQLVGRGHRFKTKSDVEVIAHGYEEYGLGFTSKLRGMFAMALWDARNQQLVLARDRLGKKPLYYAHNHGRLLFGSEIKSLLGSGEIDPQVDEQSMAHFLTLMYSPLETTLFRGIHKLPPGHMLVATRQNWRIESYWDIPIASIQGRTFDEWLEETDHRLADSVESRLMSDVPLGAFLSGGIDSSLVVNYMHRYMGPGIRTFSVGFEEKEYSELHYARAVAAKYQTDHYELVVRSNDLLDHMAEAIWFRDEPLAYPSDVALMLLSRLAAKHVKVVLSGEGGDELFAGYPKHAYDRLAAPYQLIPGLLRNHILKPIVDSLPYRFRKVQIAARCLNIESAPRRWTDWFAAFDVASKQELFTNSLRSRVNLESESLFHPYLYKLNGVSPLACQLYLDSKIWLPENLLMKGDKMTMSASIEGRIPFLDHEFVEFAFSIPDEVKLNGLTTKHILRKLAEKYLPSEITSRRKVGFTVPVGEWFRSQWGEILKNILLSERALDRGYFKREVLSKKIEEHRSGKTDHQRQLWALFNLEVWHRLFIDGTALDQVLGSTLAEQPNSFAQTVR